MVRMGDVNEATILHNLRMRFLEDLVYTNIGSILVSLNPFCWIEGLYTSELIQEHLNLPPGEISSPHVFQTAASAYNGMRGERMNQAVIISGESGAGKTEATKKCLAFFAEAAGSTGGGMENKLLSANPILEAFGNAKTVRNNNSSRFGKWMEVHFNERAVICGCQILNYLLEKSRIVFQSPTERNFHVFYQLCKAAPKEMRTKLKLGGNDLYNYTNKAAIEVDGLDDHEEFETVMESFKLLELTPSEVDPRFSVAAGVLHLSNIVFTPVDDDTCRMTSGAPTAAALANAAEQFGVTPAALQSALETKLIETKSERLKSPLSADKAADTRNALAKAVYQRQFDWLVARVNLSMVGTMRDSANIIGVLDIFGFEIFENNSFEQLCINYCNEKLQQHFNYHVFKAEERLYTAEGIDFDEVKFIDNQDVLDLVELKPNGLLPKLDDEVRVPKGSDHGFLDKIAKIHDANPRFKGRIRRNNETKLDEFGIVHYAGLVYYNVLTFLEKNKDELALNLKELMSGSTSPYIRLLFDEEAIAAAAVAKGGEKSTGNAKVSQGGQFHAQLNSLMKTLNATAPHYIRCVKPNSVKKAHIFTADICLQQLRYAGVFEAVKIRQQGYPFRWPYDQFYKRYRCIGMDPSFKAPMSGGFDWKAGVRRLLEDIVATASASHDGKKSESATVLSNINIFKQGKTMVLYRADPNRIIEAYRDITRRTAAIIIQKVYRGAVTRKVTRLLFELRDRIRSAIKGRSLPVVDTALAEGRAASFQVFEMRALETLHGLLLEEKACRELLTSLLPFDPADKYAEYEGALKSAVRLGLMGEALTGQVQHKFNTVKDRVEARANLKRGVEIGDKAMILGALAKGDALAKEWGDVLGPELREAAKTAVATIALEETLQADLKSALRNGGPSGPVGSLDTSTIDVAALDRVIKDAASGRTNVTTIVGRQLIASCNAIRSLRLALLSGDWPSIESTVAAADAMRVAGTLSPEAEGEVRKAGAEIADRRVQRVIALALASGGAKGAVGSLDFRSADPDGLRAAVLQARSQADAIGGLSAPAEHLLKCAELVARLRAALRDVHWGALKIVVAEALEVRLPEPCIPEVATAKDELDNHHLVHHLTDAVERGGPVGTVARLDVSTPRT